MTIRIVKSRTSYLKKDNLKYTNSLQLRSKSHRKKKPSKPEQLLLDAMKSEDILTYFYRRGNLYTRIPLMYSRRYRVVIDILYQCQHDRAESMATVEKKMQLFTKAGWTYVLIDHTNIMKDVTNVIEAIRYAMDLYQPCST